jgi:hypothetical protein
MDEVKLSTPRKLLPVSVLPCPILAGRYRSPPGVTMTGLELNVPDQSPALQREVISSAIDLGPQYLEVADIPPPKTPQQFAQKDMLNQLFTGAGFGVMRGFGLGDPVLAVNLHC